MILLLNNRNSAICVSLFSLHGLCNHMTSCLVEVSDLPYSRKCSMSSVVLAFHISQFVYPSVCLLSLLIFKVLALNKVVLASELSYKSCSSCIACLYSLYSNNTFFFCKSSCYNLLSNSFIFFLMYCSFEYSIVCRLKCKSTIYFTCFCSLWLYFVSVFFVMYVYSKICDISSYWYIFYIFRLVIAIKYYYITFILVNT